MDMSKTSDISSVILDRMGDKGQPDAQEDDSAGAAAATESAMGDFMDALKAGNKTAARDALGELISLLAE